MKTTTPLDPNKVFVAKMVLRHFLETLPKGMKGDAIVFGSEEHPREWDGEYGQNSLATMSLDGSSLYQIVNGYSHSAKAMAEDARLTAALAAKGMYYELGYAWSLHVYEV